MLRTIRFNDAFNVVDVYTAQRGKLSYLVPVTVRPKAKVKRLLFQPLSFVEFESDYRAKSNLHYVREAKCSYPFKSIPYEPYKSAIALFLTEFLSGVLREEMADEALFGYLSHSITWLDVARENYTNFHLVFLMRLTRFVGIYPNVENYHEGDYFDLLGGCFSSAIPDHSAFLGPQESAHIAALMRMNYENMYLFTFTREQRRRCVEVMNDYYRLHIPSFPKLKSPEVLQQLFEA